MITDPEALGKVMQKSYLKRALIREKRKSDENRKDNDMGGMVMNKEERSDGINSISSISDTTPTKKLQRRSR